MHEINRRTFLATTSLAAGAIAARRGAAGALPSLGMSHAPGDDHRGPCVIASGNGVAAVEKAWELIRGGSDPAPAVVAGVGIVESDPEDMTVGHGGLPNEEGVVQLDASVMHGPTHKAGAVACIERIKNPAAVALKVLQETDHVLIVGDGARRFAVAHGFPEENLLTDKAREAWLRWKRNANPNDDWLDDDQIIRFGAEQGMAPEDARAVLHTYGTIHCGAVAPDGAVAATTTTSGLSWKIPGRVGDSPIIGAGMYVDNDVGSAGATGRGEAVIQVCGSFLAVQLMEGGATPTEACLGVLERIARKTKRRDLLDDKGRPNFNVTMYALRKDGAYGSACLLPGGSFAVREASGPARRLDSVVLYG